MRRGFCYTMRMAFEIYGIFDIAEPDVIRYVGKTSRSHRRRLAHHKYSAKMCSDHLTPLHAWIKSASIENVDARILEIATGQSQLDHLETLWIANLQQRGMADLNVSPGGEKQKSYSILDRYAMSNALPDSVKKISDDTAKCILEMLWHGMRPNRINELTGASVKNISKIKRGETFKHISRPIGPPEKWCRMEVRPPCG